MMKDFTTTSFGLIIAYLLPGLLALYTGSSWSHSLRDLLSKVLSGNSDAALALALGAFALIAGLFINSVRWLVFEKILCRSYRVAPSVLAKLKDDPKLKAFLMVIEETFRYHQFYGTVFVMLPILCLALVRHFNVTFTEQFRFAVTTVIVIVLEIVFAALWHERNTGAAGTNWRNRKPKVLLNLSPWFCAITPFAYLIALCFMGEFSRVGNFRIAILFLLLLLGGLIIGANAIAALKRYCDRISYLTE